jgi:hypothetical protein
VCRCGGRWAGQPACRSDARALAVNAKRLTTAAADVAALLVAAVMAEVLTAAVMAEVLTAAVMAAVMARSLGTPS